MINNWDTTFVNFDGRGLMGVIEQSQIPFDIQRIFWLSNVPLGEKRGEHAHRRCRQFIICARGTVICTVEVLGQETESRQLSTGDTYNLETLTWLTLSDFSADALVMVLADEPYDESEYIRSYSDFKRTQI
jgi:UDP-2-acetamido-3-amino-2,3-dideoxy-glucuronate N-acetyltransferase